MRTDAEIIICLFNLLQQDQERTVIAAELAQAMSLSGATMHHRVEKLIKMELMSKTSKKKICLTEKGWAYAYQLQEQQYGIKAFFEMTCGLPGAEADKQAVALVAELSDGARNQLYAAMTNSQFHKQHFRPKKRNPLKTLAFKGKRWHPRRDSNAWPFA